MSQKAQARKVFTESAASYARHKGKADRATHEAVVRLSQVGEDDNVLEIGCGPGFVSLLFAEEAGEVVGIDLAELTEARRRKNEHHAANTQFVEGDVENLPFRPGSFHIVACHQAFHHFSKPTQVLAEARRVLGQGGRLVLCDTYSSVEPSKNSFHNRIEKLRDPSHVKMYSPDELTGLVNSAGFSIVASEKFQDERDFNWWMSVINPPVEVQEEIRKMMIESIPDDLAGLDVRTAEGGLFFRRRRLILAALKTRT